MLHPACEKQLFYIPRPKNEGTYPWATFVDGRLIPITPQMTRPLSAIRQPDMATQRTRNWQWRRWMYAIIGIIIYMSNVCEIGTCRVTYLY